ncbi:MAG: putative holin-like toxin [Paenibacillus macerans]|nr:putative holin-like toxin [Paenibacillus macerans]MDU7475353.1 putative holin-like toxin [Paenibacillus macerans]MEC0328597.1 putative holin-like toxin [Paenibacillus macerans]
MPVAIKDTLMIMISFAALIIALLTLVVAIIVALTQNTKK